MEWFTGFVGGLVLIVWAFRLVRSINAKVKPTKIPPECEWPNELAGHTTPEPEKELPREPVKSPNEKLVESLNSLREAIREKAEAEHRPLQNQLAHANARLAAAKKLADELGISKAVTNVACEMTFWPSWSRLEGYDFSENLVEGLTYSGGTHEQGEKHETTVNEFVMRGRHYRLSTLNEHYDANVGREFADLILERGDGQDYHQVFAAEVGNSLLGTTYWGVDNVTTIELGDWVHDMVALEELFTARRHRNGLARRL
jgi:hypothetical protein